MPATLLDNIKRKLWQSDNQIKRAIAHLADVYATVQPQHPEIAASLLTYMRILDHMRQYHKFIAEEHWGRAFYELWDPADLSTALVDATIIKDPKHHTR